ncbi:hypothetical protein DXG01_015719 [Tephrocybe rancida]|nr:hypothetical protein DXG01_015719 [Tephrocybe rancida]
MGRKRLTVKKSHGKRNITGGDPSAPTDSEWKTMIIYESLLKAISVRDEDDEEHTFKKGDKVGQPLAQHDYWVGRIREVRAASDGEVWTLVQWYWSPSEVSAQIKSFDEEPCSPYERLFSDNFDYVSSSAFDSVITMHKLNDGNLTQPYIPWDTFYTRYTFEHLTRVISVRRSSAEPQTDEDERMTPPQPNPGKYTCFCNIPYAPNSLTPPPPSSPLNTTARISVKGKGKAKAKDPVPRAHTLMHYCPRPTCRRFFHASCLLAEHQDPDTGATSRARRLLCASPDVAGEFLLGAESEKERSPGKAPREAVEDVRSRKRIRAGTPLDEGEAVALAPETASGRGRGRGRGRPRGRGRGRGRGKGTTVPSVPMRSRSSSRSPALDPDVSDSNSLDMRLAALPPDLVLIAEQPIVRGAAFRVGGLAGNLGAVVAARRTVYTALGWKPEKDEDEDEEEEKEKEQWGLEGWEERVGPVERAVVDLGVESEGDDSGLEDDETKSKGRRKKTTGKVRKRKGGEEEGVVALMCPNCNGAI